MSLVSLVGKLDERPSSSPSSLSSFLQRTRRAFAPSSSTALAPRPSATGVVRRAGRDAHHILLVGGGVLAGTGLARHDLGLPGYLADLLVRRTQRGVQMHVLVDEDITSEDSIARLRRMRIRRFDAVLVFLGAAPAEHSVTEHSWQISIEALARALDAEAGSAAPMHVYDTSSVVTMLSQTIGASRTTARAARLTEVNEDVFEHTRRIRFTALRPSLGLYGVAGGFSGNAYEEWAGLIAAALLPELALLAGQQGLHTPRSYRDSLQGPEEQAAAVGRVIQESPLDDGSFAHEIRTLQQVFGVEGVALAFLNDGRLSPVATSLNTLKMDPRLASELCALALRHDWLTLINDAEEEQSSDARTVRSAGLSFWASRPIHSWDGYRIGCLYLFDSRAHEFIRSQLDLLEDVVGRVEQQLWKGTPQRADDRSGEHGRRLAS